VLSVMTVPFHLIWAVLFNGLFRPVNRSVALLAGFVMLMACVMWTLSSLLYLAPLLLLQGKIAASAFTPEQLQALVLTLFKWNALAYDIGGLLAARRLSLPLTIVLLNNDGGGIFHFLPVAREGDAFEEHVATPHGLDFAHAAALYGCGYEQPEDAASLNAAVAASIERAGTTIIEVKTDRQANLALHRRMAEAALAALRRSDLDL